MLDLAPHPPSTAPGAAFMTAVVEDVDRRTGRARVRLDDGEHGTLADAGIAVAGDLGRGRRVLLAFQELGESWIIGLLPDRTPAPDRTVDLPDGASVRISGGETRPSVRLLSPAGRLLVEYDTATGRMSVHAPATDLELRSVEGDIVLDAAGTVHVRGEAVDARGRSRVHVASGGGPDGVASLLRLDPSGARVAGRRFGLTAERANVHVEEATYRGTRLFARLEVLELVVGRLERLAGQVHETADRVYRTVKEAMEVRAKRIRTIVGSTYQLTTRRAFLRSREDFKVKGDRIHLG